MWVGPSSLHQNLPVHRPAMNHPALLAATLLLISASVSSLQATDDTKSDDLKYCKCTGPECNCCVDFNITYIDLGGPGCVKMKYISQEEGIHVNVSYGDSQLHEGRVKGNNESATCMDILLDLAQMCATFTEISKTENGMRACASLEPTLLGDPQDSYHLGCFEMGTQGMKLMDIRPPVKPDNGANGEAETNSNQGSFFEAVNESAEDSIAWFTNFWGINFTRDTANSTEETPE